MKTKKVEEGECDEGRGKRKRKREEEEEEEKSGEEEGDGEGEKKRLRRKENQGQGTLLKEGVPLKTSFYISARSLVVEKVTSIVHKEFDSVVSERMREVEDIDKRLMEVRKALHMVRYGAVMNYFAQTVTKVKKENVHIV